MNVLHWNDIPPRAAFVVTKFVDGPYQGCWGILAKLFDGRQFWVALGNPGEEVVSPNSEMAKSILRNMQSHAKLIKAADEMDNWKEDSPSGLPHPADFPIIYWEAVPESTRLQRKQFCGGIWGILAVLPDGEYLVILENAVESSLATFHSDQQGVDKAIVFLEMLLATESMVEESSPPPASTPPFLPESVPSEELGIDRGEIEASLEEIDYLEMGWLFKLYHGKSRVCLCRSCRSWYVRRLESVADRYQNLYGDVPTEILTAVGFVLRSWEVIENNRQA